MSASHETGAPKPLYRQVAVVTGGHRGVGSAISIALAQAGADVIVIDRKGPEDSQVPEKLGELGVKYWSVCADLSDADAVTQAANEVLALVPRIHILCNNAGIALISPLDTLSVESWDSTMCVNVRAPFLLSQRLRPQKAIVNVSSVAGTHALQGHGAYCASKGALEMLTRVMAIEWGHLGVRINAVAPTVVLTDMGKKNWSDPEKAQPMLARIPVNRFAQPSEVAEAVLWLATDKSSMVNGQIITVDGGYSAQ